MIGHTINIIDLFAGVGGIRLGFEQAAHEFHLNTQCVFTSEIDDWACATYRKNFPNDGHDPKSDITKVDEKSIPDFDVLLAGFPCQAFSIAGKRGGFNDTRGTLFFDVARIIKEKRPKAFLLENVKGLTNHRSGKTLEVIINTLKEDLGYTVFYKVLNAKDYGLAQMRERIYIVGFRGDCGGFHPAEPRVRPEDEPVCPGGGFLLYRGGHRQRTGDHPAGLHHRGGRLEGLLRGLHRELHELVLGIPGVRGDLVPVAFSAAVYPGDVPGGADGESPVCGELLCERDPAGIHHHLGLPGQRPVRAGVHDLPPVCELHAGEDRHDAGDQVRGDDCGVHRRGGDRDEKPGYVL